MPAYNFKSQFARMVESGKKTQTIRKVRKYPTKSNTPIFLWFGLRTKYARRLGVGIILSVEPITIYDHYYFRIGTGSSSLKFRTDMGDAGLMLAKADGFKSWEKLVEFFESHYGLPFEGEIIKWRLLKGHDFGFPEKEI